MIGDPLPWPPETPWPAAPDDALWSHHGSNIVLDFHGDPVQAELTVLSDGNHHMALEETLREFARAHPDMGGIFYLTLPPALLLQIVMHGAIWLGNLRLQMKPHVLISPPGLFDALAQNGRMIEHAPFMRSRGNVLLVRKGNPKSIRDIGALCGDEVKLFISNPRTEAASYGVYRETLLRLGKARNMDVADMARGLEGTDGRVLHGRTIHHREAPQALASGCADTAILYYHLALRYTRVFPDEFEIVALDGGTAQPEANPWNVTSRFHAGVVGDGGRWGGKLLQHLMTRRVTDIYHRHGLLRPDE
ncbi:MAG: substrate-binding domain-containing protein [Gammaproteobacteria bacterium]|nr:substrate-binding domain-containing protein [Gammaproteobacteria bacterium]